jgi:hypothetical protein
MKRPSTEQPPTTSFEHGGKENANKRGGSLFVVASINSSGVFMPPYAVLRGRILKQEFRNGLLQRTAERDQVMLHDSRNI